MSDSKDTNSDPSLNLGLGMGADISRRDLLHDAALMGLGLVGAGLPVTASADIDASGSPLASPDAADYPPVRTGMRGSHPGSFESAHALAREGRVFPEGVDTGEHYDLVVVGAGISGLAAAHYYRQRFGDDARILILDNHDEFGGHARRNEFHQGGRMVLSMGGTHNLEWWSFSDTVKAFMGFHGVDTDAMLEAREFRYGRDEDRRLSLWFDEQTYGRNVLLRGYDLKARLPSDIVDQIPISAAGRASLKAFYAEDKNLFLDQSEADTEAYLRRIPYPEFLRRHGGLTADAVQLFDKEQHGGEGVEMRALSAMEAISSRLPGSHLIGRGWDTRGWTYNPAMWPDGNASLARLQVASLIPAVAPGTTADNVAIAEFDYDQLDRPDARLRLRLSATAVNVANRDAGVSVDYAQAGEVKRVSARHAVLACYHTVIPHICPGLPKTQRDAMKYQVKCPLILTNVLIRNTEALDKLGIDGLRCPGRLHHSLFTFRGINTGGYNHPLEDSGPVSLVFWGAPSPDDSAVSVHDMLRSARAKLLAMTFEDFEREVRTVLKGLLGPAGFDVERDVLAITVNRWPHGYAYYYLDLWDQDWPLGKAPHEIARQPHGNISMANSDAGANAYTHEAIDQAFRAVRELPA